MNGRNYISTFGLVAVLGGFGTCGYQELRMPKRMEYKNNPEITSEFKSRFKSQAIGFGVGSLGLSLMYTARKKKE